MNCQRLGSAGRHAEASGEFRLAKRRASTVTATPFTGSSPAICARIASGYRATGCRFPSIAGEQRHPAG